MSSLNIFTIVIFLSFFRVSFEALSMAVTMGMIISEGDVFSWISMLCFCTGICASDVRPLLKFAVLEFRFLFLKWRCLQCSGETRL